MFNQFKKLEIQKSKMIWQFLPDAATKSEFFLGIWIQFHLKQDPDPINERWSTTLVMGTSFQEHWNIFFSHILYIKV